MEIEQQNYEFKLNSIDDKWNELSNPTKLNRQTWEPHNFVLFEKQRSKTIKRD